MNFKVSQREWLFLAGGLVLGYVALPKILHQSGDGFSTSGCPTGNCTITNSPGHVKCSGILSDDGLTCED